MSEEQTGDWYCRNCGYLSSGRVTNAETCDQCHIPVEWHTAEDQSTITQLQARVDELESHILKMNSIRPDLPSGPENMLAWWNEAMELLAKESSQ